jgi:hypothetical protein
MSVVLCGERNMPMLPGWLTGRRWRSTKYAEYIIPTFHGIPESQLKESNTFANPFQLKVL